MKRRFTSVLAAVAMLTATNANAADWFFSPSGAGEMDGSSWENAASAEALAGALADAETIAPGDNVYLMAGTYTNQNILWTITPGVNIYGGYPSTMTGTDVNITYPTAENSVFSADIDGDGKGDNGTTVLVTLGSQYAEDGTTEMKKEDAPLTYIAGVTFRDANNATDKTYLGSAMEVNHTNLELAYVQFINNTIGYLDADGTSLKGAGAALLIRGSYVYAHDCVWADNVGTRSGSAILVRGAFGKSGTSDGAVKGTNPAPSIVYLDRCEFTNNTVVNPNAAKAQYGGTLAISDYSGELYMNNCTATGTRLFQSGAFCRVGGGDKFYMSNSTIFDFDCLATTWTSGDALSCGTASKVYLANTVIVQKTDGAEEGTKFTCVYAQNNGEFISGGYNVWGSFTSEVTPTLLDSDNHANTNTMSVVLGSDSPTYAAQGGNGTKVVAVKEDYRGMTVAALQDFNTKYGSTKYLDVTLDQRGLVRPETTISGAYDPKATAASSAIENTFAAKAEALKVATLGNGNYAVNATGVARVYDLSGKLVLTQVVNGNDVINLSGVAKGVYVIRVNSQAQKIIK